MDLNSYNAAAEGKIEVFKDITEQSLDFLLTPNKNTVLHIYITALKSRLESTAPNAGLESTTLNPQSKSRTNFVDFLNIVLNFRSNVGLELITTLNARSKSRTNFVEEILIMCPTLLQQANAKGETPLHIAARYGHDDIVDVLIKYCAPTLHQDLEGGIGPVKEMLRMTNKEKDTALHEAVRYNHLKVVALLIKEDPDFSYSANNSGETPLYIAAERGFEDVLFNILDKCKSPMHVGPLGRTALHAAIMCYSSDMTSKILEKIEAISRKVDDIGWTPLHLAAYCYSVSTAKLLLDKDREVAYMKDKEGRTALHIAAKRGNNWVMESIVSSCPDCCELVDNRGWNVLHSAMKAGGWRQNNIIKIVIENSSLSNLLNEKNADGDTPLHYYANSLKSANYFINHPRVDKMAFNKQNLTAYNIASAKKKSEIMSATKYPRPRRVITYEDGDKNKDEEKQKEDERSMLQKAAEAHLVVAALITTVTFAAGITMPGGFTGGGEGSHPGSALLRRNAAFKAFVITDIISMVLSSSAVFLHLLMPFLEIKSVDDAEHRRKFLHLAFKFILWAMVAMGLAFVTGTYAVLQPSWDIAISNLIIGLTFFVALLFGFIKFSKISFGEFLSYLLSPIYLIYIIISPSPLLSLSENLDAPDVLGGGGISLPPPPLPPSSSPLLFLPFLGSNRSFGGLSSFLEADLSTSNFIDSPSTTWWPVSTSS